MTERLMLAGGTTLDGGTYRTALPDTFGLLAPDRQAWLREVVLPLPGWCDPDKACRLADLVIAACPAWSVDLGVFGARSTVALAEGHRFLGHGQVVGIDPYTAEAAIEGTNDLINDQWWTDLDLDAIYRVAVHVMLQHARTPHWTLRRLDSREAAREFVDGSVGLLHQDSNHSPEVSQAELIAWLPKMTAGAYWIMDDTLWPSLQETQRILVETHGATLVEDWRQWRVYQLP